MKMRLTIRLEPKYQEFNGGKLLCDSNIGVFSVANFQKRKYAMILFISDP